MPLKPGHTIQSRVFKDPQQRPASTSLFQGLLCWVQSFHLLGAVFLLLSSGTKFCSPSWLAAALRPLHLLLTSNPSSFSDFVKKTGAKTLYQKNKIRNRFEEAAVRLAC